MVAGNHKGLSSRSSNRTIGSHAATVWLTAQVTAAQVRTGTLDTNRTRWGGVSVAARPNPAHPGICVFLPFYS